MNKKLILAVIAALLSAGAAQACVQPAGAEEMRRAASMYYWMKDGPLRRYSGTPYRRPYCSPSRKMRIGKRNWEYFLSSGGAAASMPVYK